MAAAASSAALAAEIADEIEDRDITERGVAEAYGGGLAGINVFANKGCQRLHDLLVTLAAVFPENGKLSFWLGIFESTILGNADREKWAMERWHREMTTTADGATRPVTLYQKVKDRDVAFLLDSGVWVLDEIDATSMYNDPDLDDEDREHICRHFERVNACAEWMATMPSDMMEFVMQAAAGMDPTQPLSPESLFPILQKTLGLGGAGGGVNADAMERIVGWTSQMMGLMQNGGLQSLMSIAGEAATLAGTAMPNMAAVLQTVQTELMGCGELLSSDTADGTDTTQLNNMTDVLRSWSGGAAAGGAGSA